MNKKKQPYKGKGRNAQQGKSNRKPYGKPMEKKESYEQGGADKASSYKGFNDVSWYTKNQQMLNDSASFSYNSPLGTPLPWDQIFKDGSRTLGTPIRKDAVPGLFQLLYAPIIGVSLDSTSPANLAAQNIYSYVRYMNSGAKNYDQADLMLYLLAMDSVYMMWNYAKRVMLYAQTYSQYNKYLPKILAYSDCVDLDDLQANMADYRARLNALATNITSFCVPAVMPLFLRHSWMASNIYKDSSSVKSQMYIMTPVYAFKYSETGSKFGGSLTPVSTPINTSIDAGKFTIVKFSAILNMIKELLDAISYSEDIGVMSGDILKAYGQEKLFKITAVTPDESIEPVYNEEVLSQIHNSSTMYAAFTTAADQWTITQDPNTGFLKFNPRFTKRPITYGATLLNSRFDSPTAADNMIATRLAASTYEADDGVYIDAAGSELVMGYYIYSWTRGTDGTLNINVNQIPDAWIFNADETAASMTTRLINMARVAAFDWHPLIPLFAATTSTGDLTLCGMVGDINNYTIISDYNLEMLHTNALLSEFNVPQLGSF